MEPNWPNIALLALLLFAILVVYGAWQGWFSPVEAPPVSVSISWASEKKMLQETLQRAKDTIFQYENAMPQMDASIADSGDVTQSLMNDINTFTARINELENENAALRKGLREALEDLARLRKLLMECRASMDANRLEEQYCNKEVPSNLLY
jgi:chromosome segregation ATPase